MKKLLFTIILFLYFSSGYGQTYTICLKGKVKLANFDFESNFGEINQITKGDTFSAFIKYTLGDVLYINRDSTLYRFTSPKLNDFRIRINKLEFVSHPIPIIDLNFYKETSTSQDTRGRSDFYFKSIKNNYPELKTNTWSQTAMEFHGIDSINNDVSRALPLYFDPLKLHTILQFMGESSIPSSPIKHKFYIVAHPFEIKFDCLDYLTSIQENSYSYQPMVSPNPSSTGFFWIEGFGDLSQIKIYDAKGDAIVPQIINATTLDLSSFPSGIYMVVANVNDTIITKKLIKE